MSSMKEIQQSRYLKAYNKNWIRHRWITQFVSRIAASEVLCQVWDTFRDFEGLEIFEQS